MQPRVPQPGTRNSKELQPVRNPSNFELGIRSPESFVFSAAGWEGGVGSVLRRKGVQILEHVFRQGLLVSTEANTTELRNLL